MTFWSGRFLGSLEQQASSFFARLSKEKSVGPPCRAAGDFNRSKAVLVAIRYIQVESFDSPLKPGRARSTLVKDFLGEVLSLLGADHFF